MIIGGVKSIPKMTELHKCRLHPTCTDDNFNKVMDPNICSQVIS